MLSLRRVDARKSVDIERLSHRCILHHYVESRETTSTRRPDRVGTQVHYPPSYLGNDDTNTPTWLLPLCARVARRDSSSEPLRGSSGVAGAEVRKYVFGRPSEFICTVLNKVLPLYYANASVT